MILNGKENKETSAICFEIRIPKKNNETLLRKVPSKIYEVISLWKKTKKEKKKNGFLIFLNIITEQWGYRLRMLLLNQIHLKNFWFSLPYFLLLELVYEQIYSSRLVCCLLPVENTINDSSNLDTHICPCLLRQHADKFLSTTKEKIGTLLCM